MADEKIYIIPLRAEWEKAPRYKRAKKAIRAIREFLVQHMKIYDRDLRKVKIARWLNMHIWERGIKKPPSKVKVKVTQEGEIVTAELAELPRKALKQQAAAKAIEDAKNQKGKPVEKKEEPKVEEKPKEEVKLGGKKPEEKVEEKKEEVKEEKKEDPKVEEKPVEAKSEEKKEEPKEQTAEVKK